MLAVVELYQPDNLHAHVRLVHDAPREREHPEVAGLGVADRQVHIGYPAEPAPVLPVELGAVSSFEHFCAERGDLPPVLCARVKKAASV
jgi:hypothetical protein